MKIDFYVDTYISSGIDGLISQGSFNMCCSCRRSLNSRNCNQCIIFYGYDTVCINTICNTCLSNEFLAKMYFGVLYKICNSPDDAIIFMRNIKKAELLR